MFKENIMIHRFWNGMTHEEWSAKQKEVRENFKAGHLKVQLPEGVLRIEAEYGDFVEVLPSCLLKYEPHISFYKQHYGPALKVMIPKRIKAGGLVAHSPCFPEWKIVDCRNMFSRRKVI